MLVPVTEKMPTLCHPEPVRSGTKGFLEGMIADRRFRLISKIRFAILDRSPKITRAYHIEQVMNSKNQGSPPASAESAVDVEKLTFAIAKTDEATEIETGLGLQWRLRHLR